RRSSRYVSSWADCRMLRNEIPLFPKLLLLAQQHRVAPRTATCRRSGPSPCSPVISGGGMNNILVINSSAAGDDAASRVLVRSVVDALLRGAPGATVVERDVGREPIPHLTGDALGGLGRDDAQTPGARRTRALSDTLIAEL